MIAHLKGTLLRKMPASALLDVNGVGYEVFIPLTTYYELPGPGEPLSFFIHTHVREDALKLFGFLREEKTFLFKNPLSAPFQPNPQNLVHSNTGLGLPVF